MLQINYVCKLTLSKTKIKKLINVLNKMFDWIRKYIHGYEMLNDESYSNHFKNNIAYYAKEQKANEDEAMKLLYSWQKNELPTHHLTDSLCFECDQCLSVRVITDRLIENFELFHSEEKDFIRNLRLYFIKSTVEKNLNNFFNHVIWSPSDYNIFRQNTPTLNHTQSHIINILFLVYFGSICRAKSKP